MMNDLQALFASGRVVDAVLLMLVLELLVLRLWLGRPAVLPLPTLAAGAGLLLAWRFTLADLHWTWAAAALTAAGAAHGCDLWRLWRAT